jgi:hypothetical protein
MSWPSDWLTGVYLFLFAFGLLFSAASLFFSVGDDLPGLDLDGDSNTDHVGAPSPLSLSTILIFLMWFGATGYIARTWGGLAAWLTVIPATVVGLIGAALVYLLLAKVLWRGQTHLDPANYDIRGTVARVTSPVRPGGTGEIVYMLDGKQRVDGARSVDDAALPAGAEVTIVRYTEGIAYVAPLQWADQNFLGDPVEPLSLPPPVARWSCPAATDEGREARAHE